jgi:GTPase Era involved in 16S rRNA processing
MTERCGLVAVLGAPNAGKSTLVNALVGQKVAIVSPKAQTTRTRLMGIAIEGEAQLLLVDTPGIFDPRRRLDRAMVAAAWGGTEGADLIALVIDGGTDAAAKFVTRIWEPHLAEQRKAPKHPKSELQELAAARECKPPVYEVVGRTGAHHHPKFTIRVSVPGLGEATAEGTSKQDAETDAAGALLKKLQ